MANGFWPAGGKSWPQSYSTTASSAFSKGDLLAMTTSGLSRLNPYALGSGALYGVAAGDSTQSIDGFCVAHVVTNEALWWSRTTSGVTLFPGETSGVSFVASAPGRYWVDESTSTNAVVVVKGTMDIDQSVESKVLVRFIDSGGELDLNA